VNDTTTSIAIEACKTLCELKNITNKELAQTISALNSFLFVSSSVVKYSALKIIQKVRLSFLVELNMR